MSKKKPTSSDQHGLPPLPVVTQDGDESLSAAELDSIAQLADDSGEDDLHLAELGAALPDDERAEDADEQPLAFESFDELDLEPALVAAVEQLGLTTPTEVQGIAIPHGLEGEDLLICAHTGTGKTLAYCLPLLQRLMDQQALDPQAPRALVLVPTRELGNQVLKVIASLLPFVEMRATLLVGGVPIGEQVRQLQECPEILIATPGRLLELVLQGEVELHALQAVVLDEADRMVEMGFVKLLAELIERIGHKPQTWLCSATLDNRELEDFAEAVLNEPVEVILSSSDAPTHLRQFALQADNEEHKQALLLALLKDKSINQAVVFVATRKQVDSIAQLVLRQGGLYSDGLHGDLNQGGRSDVLSRFRRGRTRVLVATDIASRGLDIDTITHVINYNLPVGADDYVHRIGRAGRVAGSEGVAWSLVDSNDLHLLGRMERYQGVVIPWISLPGLEPKRKLKPKPRKPKVKKNAKATKTATPVKRAKRRPGKLKAKKTGKS
ncbi:DEAD/DEAH box helicase [Pokkaliibacter plantistimulans]|uniref:DEAD/DEAH box helicase n=1 Tax=Pokkaliibacter plantistimulans TaxID=1635171 RepID=UPI000D74F61B|nr:DEAD/DEAH box helicase [Pokkaliibacter plantistimulans]